MQSMYCCAVLTVVAFVVVAVAQVGSSAAEWSSVLKAVQHLAEPQQQAACQAARSQSGTGSSTHAPSPADLRQTASAAVSSSSGGGGGSSIGSTLSSSGGSCQEVAGELLAELQHLPCFLLMEFVEGCKLSDTVAAVDPVSFCFVNNSSWHSSPAICIPVHSLLLKKVSSSKQTQATRR